MKSDSDNSGKQKLRSDGQGDERPPNKVQDAALTFVLKLRESGCEQPNLSSEQAAKNLHDATFSYIKRLKETEPTSNEPPRVKLAEKSSKTCEHIAVSQSTPEQSKSTMRSSSLPPRDSPLTKAFAGQYVSSLVEETIRYLRLPLNVLAKEMLIPEIVLRDVVQGKMGMTRGQWIKLDKLLKIATNFQLVKSERDGTP